MENDTFESRNIKDKGWFWVDNDALWVVADSFGSSGIAVYVLLCRYADNDKQECFPSISKLAEKCKMSRHTVIDILKRFQVLNVVSIVKTTGRANVYQMLKVTSVCRGTGACGDTTPVPVETLPPVSVEAHEKDLINKDLNKKNLDIISEAALTIVNKYEMVIRSGQTTGFNEAVRHMKYALCSGETEEDVLARVEAYRVKCVEENIAIKYRYLPCNFFSRKQYKDYDPIREVKYTEADPDCTECFGSGFTLAPGTGKRFPCFKCRKEIVLTKKEEL